MMLLCSLYCITVITDPCVPALPTLLSPSIFPASLLLMGCSGCSECYSQTRAIHYRPNFKLMGQAQLSMQTYCWVMTDLSAFCLVSWPVFHPKPP
ncbi:hypothetical protein EDC04DRAFT_3098000, partial [Pisolithus marmoratus]